MAQQELRPPNDHIVVAGHHPRIHRLNVLPCRQPKHQCSLPGLQVDWQTQAYMISLGGMRGSIVARCSPSTFTILHEDTYPSGIEVRLD